MGWFSILLTATLAWSPPTDSIESGPLSFQLQDFRGAWHRLDDVPQSRAVVIAFLGTECPLASIYAPRLAELARAYEKKGVAFFGGDANSRWRSGASREGPRRGKPWDDRAVPPVSARTAERAAFMESTGLEVADESPLPSRARIPRHKSRKRPDSGTP